MILTKDEVYDEVARRVAGVRMPETRLHAMCLYWGVFTVACLREQGEPAILQAGSCTWPRIRPQDDDGVVSTHFGYVWENPTPKEIRKKIEAGTLPEMHVWAGIMAKEPEDQQIVDLTAGFFPKQAKEIGGFDWRAAPPPKYLWSTLAEMRKTWVVANFTPTYRADVNACALAVALVREELGPLTLGKLGISVPGFRPLGGR